MKKLSVVALLSIIISAVVIAKEDNNKTSVNTAENKDLVLFHGTPSIPASRQYRCKHVEGLYWPEDGSGIKQQDCRVAYQYIYNKYKNDPQFVKNRAKLAAQAVYQFEQENEFSKNITDYNNLDAVRAAVPDEQLCSGGNTGTEIDSRNGLWNDKSGVDQVAPWQATPLARNAQGKLTINYAATATHDPSFFEVYISKDGYDASKSSLKWDDLVLLDTIRGLAPIGNNYKLVIDPKNYLGKRVIFIRWQRVDPIGEGFYSCSDVNIQ